MTDLFFFGTLRYVPLLRRVLQRDVDVYAATLPDHAVHWVKDQPFPVMVPRAGETVEGLYVPDLSEQDVARLNFYEGGFDYTLEPRDVMTDQGTQHASVYFPPEGRWALGDTWSLDDWIKTWGALTLDAADEAMGHYGNSDAEEVAQLFPFIRARAWARQLAKQGAPTEVRRKPDASDIEIETPKQGYDGFFRLRPFSVSYKRFDGTRSQVLEREAYLAFDAALVLPYDPHKDQVLLIEQMRYGPLWRADPTPWVLEPVAGLVDAGEPPEETAKREATEEAGVDLTQLEKMCGFYPSPGYTSEYFHCYLGICDLDGHDGTLGGLEAENEDIRNHVMPFDKAMGLIDSGEINVGPLVTMLLWLARHRDRVRAIA